MTKTQRQAVVLIHGIGEQRPMDTLRSFVVGVGEKRYYSKPDRLSDSLELRRYTLPSTSRRPITDCYELYWAHHLNEGKFRETLYWAVALAFRRPFWRLDRTLRGIIAFIQLGSLLAVSLIAWSIVEQAGSQAVGEVWQLWQSRLAVALVVVQAVAGRFITGSLADAARYLTPHPRNIAARNSIRAEGLRLLEKLHDDGTYQRVVLVGHSLGSVIGLDLLRLAWDELRYPDPPCIAAQPEAKGFDDQAAALGNSPRRANVEAFQQAQHRLWHENRERGVRWLVTDFVTLGSPLAHATLLLGTRKVSVGQRLSEGEYPRCPPLADGGPSFRSWRFEHSGRPRNLLVGHHWSPFGPTRWTNLYFPVRHSILGDPVGGPIAREFGPGVHDIPVRLSLSGWKALLCQLLAIPHVLYWARADEWKAASADRRERDRATGTRDANTALRHALGLEILSSKTPYPPPPPPRSVSPASTPTS
jgi:hypothetical protein